MMLILLSDFNDVELFGGPRLPRCKVPALERKNMKDGQLQLNTIHNQDDNEAGAHMRKMRCHCHRLRDQPSGCFGPQRCDDASIVYRRYHHRSTRQARAAALNWWCSVSVLVPLIAASAGLFNIPYDYTSNPLPIWFARALSERSIPSRRGAVRLDPRRLEFFQPHEVTKESPPRTHSLVDGPVFFKKSQLHRISESVRAALLEHDDSHFPELLRSCSDLTLSLEELADARTTQQVVRASARLESALFPKNAAVDTRNAATEEMPHVQQFPGNVLDCVCRAAALAGLVPLAVRLVDQMTGARDPQQFPSPPTQEALLTTLRKLRRRSQMMAVMETLIHTAESLHPSNPSQPPLISTTAWNVFLAALCDPILQKQRAGANSSSSSSKEECLDRAARYLLTHRQCVRPNDVSFATVLQACAKLGNHSLACELWGAMRQRAVAPSAVAYNAQLELASKLDAAVRDKVALGVWNDLLADAAVQPDRYSINLVLLPLIRTGRLDELESLLDQFVASGSQSLVSAAFAAFLATMVQEGELAWARKVLDTYIIPSLSPVLSGSAGTLRLVRPDTRHFNIVLSGYQRLLEPDVTPKSRRGNNKGKSTLHTDTAFSYQDVWQLYRTMQASQDCRPNEYTVTLLSSLCQTSEELSSFLAQVLQSTEIALQSAVLRAAITAYGRMGDASSACWLYAAYGGSDNGTRLWNTLLGAMCNAHSFNPDVPFDIDSCSAARALSNGNSVIAFHALYRVVNGKKCAEALMHILELASDSQKLLPTLDSQSYCILTSALQQSAATGDFALSLFRNATRCGVPADGRFVNSVLRCFGSDIDAAVFAWKSEIRSSCLQHERRQLTGFASDERVKGKNLLPAYHGLLYVAGRAVRPQMALRLVYAMKREGLEPDETGLNCYYSGKLVQNQIRQEEETDQLSNRFQALVKLYESLLYVECTKYDKNDKRRIGEQRVRIIV